jgi:hypothetical protein
MPSFSMVVFIVVPCKGMPLSACRTSGSSMHPSESTGCYIIVAASSALSRS